MTIVAVSWTVILNSTLLFFSHHLWYAYIMYLSHLYLKKNIILFKMYHYVCDNL